MANRTDGYVYSREPGHRLDSGRAAGYDGAVIAESVERHNLGLIAAAPELYEEHKAVCGALGVEPTAVTGSEVAEFVRRLVTDQEANERLASLLIELMEEVSAERRVASSIARDAVAEYRRHLARAVATRV